jgi:hypothetical protein
MGGAMAMAARTGDGEEDKSSRKRKKKERENPGQMTSDGAGDSFVVKRSGESRNAYRKEWETGLNCMTSTRPDAGRFIADAIHTRQVLYTMTGEPKGAREIRTGREGGKRPIYSIVLSKPTM